MDFVDIFKAILPLICSLAFYFLPKCFPGRKIFGVEIHENMDGGEKEKIINLYKLLTAICAVILFALNLFCIIKFETEIADVCLAIIILAHTALTSGIYFFGAYMTHRCMKKYVGALCDDDREKNITPVSTKEADFCPSLWIYIGEVVFILTSILIICPSYDIISPYLPLWCDFFGVGMFYVLKSYHIIVIPIALQVIFILVGVKVSHTIKYAPLDIKRITTAAQLDKSRKKRCIRFLWVCMIVSLFNLGVCIYILCMFIMPQLRLFVLWYVYAVLLAAMVSLVFVMKK